MLWLRSLLGLLRSRLRLSLVGLLGMLGLRLLRLGLVGLLGMLRLRLLRLSLLGVLRGLWRLSVLCMLRRLLRRFRLLGVLRGLLRLGRLGVLLLRLWRLALSSWLLVWQCLRMGGRHGWPRCLLRFTLLLFGRALRFLLILCERRGNRTEKQTDGSGTGNSKDIHTTRSCT